MKAFLNALAVRNEGAAPLKGAPAALLVAAPAWDGKDAAPPAEAEEEFSLSDLDL